MASETYDTTSYELADVGTRLIALIIDNVILGIIGGILFGTTRQGAVSGGAAFVIGVIYFWYFWTQRDGQTPGNSFMNIRVVKSDGTLFSATDAIIRYVGYYINSFIFGLGWLWALFDSNKQGWHDKLAKTYVVRADKEKRKNTL